MSLSKVPLEAIKAPFQVFLVLFDSFFQRSTKISLVSCKITPLLHAGPEMVRRSFESVKPAALVARPLKAFKSETTTGVSAPPMGSTMLTPKKPQKAVFAKRQVVP